MTYTWQQHLVISAQILITHKLTSILLHLKVLSTHLRIGSAHNKAGTSQIRHCPNFASFELFLSRKYGLCSYTSIANQNSVRYSVSISYFINIAVQNVKKRLFTLRVDGTFKHLNDVRHD